MLFPKAGVATTMPLTGHSGLAEDEVFRLPDLKGYSELWLSGLLGQMASKCARLIQRALPAASRPPGGLGQCPEASPESSMGSLSADLRTWSDSPVRELSSILRSLPWMSTPSAGSRSPKTSQVVRPTSYGFRCIFPCCLLPHPGVVPLDVGPSCFGLFLSEEIHPPLTLWSS